MKKILKRINIGIIAILLIVTGCSKNDNDTKSQTKSENTAKTETTLKSQSSSFIGSKAPDFTLKTLEGENVSLDQFSGKVILLNFWGTWCPPCRKEIPDLVNIYSENKDKGLEIVGITLNSGSPEKIQNFANKNNMNYQILTGEQAKTMQIAKKYNNLRSIPTTFIIDREGIIRHKWVGPRSKEKFMEEINKYL
ncbi:MAG: redoxin domain-containing protein [Candidatus Marinimicrobia bacterium]|nr:redoxin domain-containing protein [Candidatus Neomarinimicrobiota bacterium]